MRTNEKSLIQNLINGLSTTQQHNNTTTQHALWREVSDRFPQARFNLKKIIPPNGYF
jgi:hypothetical protein